jgi:hypothetical protein
VFLHYLINTVIGTFGFLGAALCVGLVLLLISYGKWARGK